MGQRLPESPQLPAGGLAAGGGTCARHTPWPVWSYRIRESLGRLLLSHRQVPRVWARRRVAASHFPDESQKQGSEPRMHLNCGSSLHLGKQALPPLPSPASGAAAAAELRLILQAEASQVIGELGRRALHFTSKCRSPIRPRPREPPGGKPHPSGLPRTAVHRHSWRKK